MQLLSIATYALTNERIGVETTFVHEPFNSQFTLFENRAYIP